MLHNKLKGTPGKGPAEIHYSIPLDKNPDSITVDAALDNLFPKRQIKRVLLLNPPDSHAEMFQRDTALRGHYTNFPPYGLLVLANVLRSMDISVALTNLTYEVLKQSHEDWSQNNFDYDKAWQDCLDTEIIDFEPDVIGITCMFTMTHISFKRVCEWVSRSGIPIVTGGVHPSNDPMKILNEIACVDAVFLGEAEVAFSEFVRAVNKEVSASCINQVILNTAATYLSFDTPRVPDTTAIDIIPAWDLNGLEDATKYGRIGMFNYFKPKRERFATVLSNRGCRAQCTFCSVRNFNGKGVRQRDVESVLDELELLVNDYGVRHIMWLDDDLLKDEKRAIALFEGIIRRNLSLTWDAGNGLIAYSCTDEVCAAMAASGCIAINIGIESGNPSILKQVRKPGTVEKFIEAALNIRKYEQIYAAGLLMVGFPGETMRMVMDTIELAYEMKLDWFRIAPLQALPNTVIREEMDELGLLNDTDTTEVRFEGGAFGKQIEREQGLRVSTEDFREVFNEISLDEVPSQEQIADIWFYMNYYLNFHRLFFEYRPEKIRQQISTLANIANVVTPENAFALYFLAVLNQRKTGRVNTLIVDRLRNRLQTSVYWQDKFKAFGLTLAEVDKQEVDLFQEPIPIFPKGYVGPFSDVTKRQVIR